jgi:hypothetical protein
VIGRVLSALRSPGSQNPFFIFFLRYGSIHESVAALRFGQVCTAATLSRNVRTRLTHPRGALLCA